MANIFHLPPSYVACLGAKIFKFLWRVTFGAETKTGLCSSSDSLVIRKIREGRNSDIPNCVADTKKDIQLLLQLVMK